MKFFALFIYRPVATILLSVAITLCGILGFRMLPVAPLPQVDFPVIMVSASLPGASPETMASSVATPLERSLGRIAGVSEMTRRKRWSPICAISRRTDTRPYHRKNWSHIPTETAHFRKSRSC